jgi:hypothetical protein
MSSGDHLVDELIALRDENHALREEVQERRVAVAEMLQALKAAAEQLRQVDESPPRDPGSLNGRRSMSERHNSEDYAVGSAQLQPAVEQLARQIAQINESLSHIDTIALIDQIERLNGELVQLRAEIQTLYRRQALSLIAHRETTVERQPPRFQPLRPANSDIIIESSCGPGFWRRLKRPWYYLPLTWGTLAIVLILACLLVFFD